MIDWESLILRGVEGKDLDYKGPCAWDGYDKKTRCELVKDILALANTGGGWLVIGVRETGTSFTPDGVSDGQAASFETTQVNTFLNNYADPPINTSIHKPEVGGKRFIAIGVPGFSDTPHICQKEFPGVLTAPTLYVRTSNNESAPIKSSADFRSIVERATRNRADSILESVRAVLTHGVVERGPSDREQFEIHVSEAQKRCDKMNPHQTKGYGYRECVFYPAFFIAERFDLPTLKSMALNASVNFWGRPFLYAKETLPDLITAIQDGYQGAQIGQSVVDDSDELHFWQLRQSGMLYVKEVLPEDARRPEGIDHPVLGYEVLSVVAFEAVHCLVKLYDGQFSDSEEVTLRFVLTGTMGRELRSPDPWKNIGQYSCQIGRVEYTKTHSLADWRSAQVEHALDICKFVFERFNWEHPDLGGSRQLIEKTINRRP